MNTVKSYFYIFCLISSVSMAAPTRSGGAETRRIQQSSTWMLGSLLSMAESDPNRLLSQIEEDFKPESLKAARQRPEMAFAWQDRMAYLGAMTQFFNPEGKIKGNLAELKGYRLRARKLINQALLGDVSLLVRDGAVEAVRRINRMQPTESSSWKSVLEQAFEDRKNVLDGEGLFIRETILTALREGSLSLSQKVRRMAETDQNNKVRDLLSLWSTAAFDTL